MIITKNTDYWIIIFNVLLMLLQIYSNSLNRKTTLFRNQIRLQTKSELIIIRSFIHDKIVTIFNKSVKFIFFQEYILLSFSTVAYIYVMWMAFKILNII